MEANVAFTKDYILRGIQLLCCRVFAAFYNPESLEILKVLFFTALCLIFRALENERQKFTTGSRCFALLELKVMFCSVWGGKKSKSEKN